MSKPGFLSALALCAGFSAAPGFAADGPREGLTIPQVYERLAGQGYWNIDRIEREAGSYEVSANDRNGDRVKLYVSAGTGEILERRVRSASRDRYVRDGRPGSGARGTECNERRCRDDLPAAPKAPAPTTDGGAGKP